MKYYDQNNNRLVYLRTKATSEFWDDHWQRQTAISELAQTVRSVRRSNSVITTTRRYLPLGSKIIEGGCGRGQFVYALHRLGYRVTGVDFAAGTINRVKKLFPELDLTVADLRSLPFPNDSFDGYWSMGVIEHFYHGFADILQEVKRVLKSNGYLFLTFPHLSVIRKIKAHGKRYPAFNPSLLAAQDFYQFALDDEDVTATFARHNFQLIAKKYEGGIKGLKDEVGFLHTPLQKIYDSPHLPVKLIKHGISLLCSRIASHSILLVLQKTGT